MIKKALIFILRQYKKFISPFVGDVCKYKPTCSEYAMEAIKEMGIIKGGLKTMLRIARCNPFSKGGFDPVRKECHNLLKSKRIQNG